VTRSAITEPYQVSGLGAPNASTWRPGCTPAGLPGSRS
jgi:hypothetical protein